MRSVPVFNLSIEIEIECNEKRERTKRLSRHSISIGIIFPDENAGALQGKNSQGNFSWSRLTGVQIAFRFPDGN